MPVNTILDRFIFIVRPFAHENPSQSGASRKRSSNRRSLKTWAIRLHMDGDSILRLGQNLSTCYLQTCLQNVSPRSCPQNAQYLLDHKKIASETQIKITFCDSY